MMNLSRSSLENTVKHFKLSFLQIRDPKAEFGRFPSFLEAFHHIISTENRIPDQEQFLLDYRRLHPHIEVTQGLEARIRRAYPSLVRELHARLLAEETFKDTSYSIHDDLRGIDLTVHYLGEDHFLHFFVDTKHSNYFRLLKDNRHDFDGNHIDITLNLKQGKRVGDFIFYPDNTFESLKMALDSRSKKKERAV